MAGADGGPSTSGSTSSPGPTRAGGWQAVQVPSDRVRSFDVAGCFFHKALTPQASAPVTAMCYMAGRVWVGCANGFTQIWDVKTMTLLKEVRMHDKDVRSLLALGGREVWSASPDGTAKVWDETGEHVADLQTKTEIYCFMELPPGREDTRALHHVWAGSKEVAKKRGQPENGLIQIWQVSTRKLKKVVRLDPPAGGDLLFAPVPLAMLYHGHHVWIASGTRILCFEPNSVLSKGYLDDHRGDIKVLMSLDKEIWSAGADGLIKVWNPEERGSDCIATMEGHGGEIVGLCTDKRCVWSCGWDKKMFLWDAVTHQYVKCLSQQHKESIAAIAYITLDEEQGQPRNYVWSAGKDRIICVWR